MSGEYEEDMGLPEFKKVCCGEETTAVDWRWSTEFCQGHLIVTKLCRVCKKTYRGSEDDCCLIPLTKRTDPISLMSPEMKERIDRYRKESFENEKYADHAKRI